MGREGGIEMTNATNRVLSIDEVMALPEGARVRYEENQKFWRALCRTMPFCPLTKHDLDYLAPPNYDGYGTYWRVWSLPQPPTPEEIEANPWTKGEANV